QGGQSFPGQEPQRQGGGLSGAFGNGARLGARGQGDAPGRTEPGQPNLFGHGAPASPGQNGRSNAFAP
ncbi:hypothetical protein G3I39_27180, partial [Streptomyces fulvissimus]